MEGKCIIMSEEYIGKCALCGKTTTLEMSHIIPKLAIRRLKRTSIGAIRNTANPNVPIQDGEKQYLLCGECEDLFSKYETYFANTVFNPYLDRVKTEFNYDKRLFYFLTSVSWRCLYLDLIDFVKDNQLDIDALEKLIESEKIMRDFLLNKRDNIDNIENHIFFFDDIREVCGDNFDYSLQPHTTFHRGITGYTVCSSNKTYFTLTNMLGVMIITIYNMGEDEEWENTKIINGNGVIKAANQHIRSAVCNELLEIMQMVKNSENDLSDIQRNKIEKKLLSAKDKLQSSEIYREVQKDNNLKKS